MKKVKATSGSVVLVPLAPGEFAVGVVVHTAGKGPCVGAFFGPRVSDASHVALDELRIENAVWVCWFGDYGIHNRLWPVIGSIPNWSNAPWSVTRFTRSHDNPALCYVTEYDSLLNLKAEHLVPAALGRGLPDDALFGSGIVEKRLAKLVPYFQYPHFHPATGPDSVKRGAHPLPEAGDPRFRPK